MEIDYSAIEPPPASKTNAWKPPRHVYFGKKDPETGELESEPIYKHQDYPWMIYRSVEGKISARIVQNKTEHDKYSAEGWKNSPAEFGLITAPSFDQALAMREAAEVEATPDAPRRGRPPKVEA